MNKWKNEKLCCDCWLYKKPEDFNRRKLSNNTWTLQSRCKACLKIRNKEWISKNKLQRKQHKRKEYEKNKNRYISNNYKRIYGITLEDYEVMLSKQNGQCAICGCTQRYGKRLAIDHCHTTGKIRGILCVACNQGIGHFKDSVEILYKVIEYLNKSQYLSNQ